MKTTFTKITATTLAVLTLVFTFCFSSFASQEASAADVYIGGNKFQFDNMIDAWNKAADSEEASRIVLKADWTADAEGSFGKGDNFHYGAMYLYRKQTPVTIDLNGYKIDRGLKEAKTGGLLFLFDQCKDIVFTDSSEAKTGTITGANNNVGEGGAFFIQGSKVKFENLAITGNKAANKGGAVYMTDYNPDGYKLRSDVTFDNCKVYGNEAKTGGAVYADVQCDLRIFDTEITGNKAVNDAGIHTELNGFYKPEIILGGKVKIADNIAEKEGKGITLDENFFFKVVITLSKERALSDESEIVVLSKTDDKTLRITKDSDNSHKDAFRYENGRYEIVAKGSDSKQYLDIKKN